MSGGAGLFAGYVADSCSATRPAGIRSPDSAGPQRPWSASSTRRRARGVVHTAGLVTLSAIAAEVAALCAPVVGGSPRQAWETLRRDGAAHPSPNAGRLEAAFAGALGVCLGGTLAYSGSVEHRPPIGEGPAPTPGHVRRAARLSRVFAALAAFGLAAARRAHSFDGAR